MRASHARSLACVVVGIFVLCGCSSGPEVVQPTGPRSATSPDQVKIHTKAPKKYEDLGTVTVTGAEGAKWDERGDATEGVEILKRKAAERGANGLLLKVAKGEYEQLVLVGYKDEYYQVPIRGTPPTAVAQAIYVLEEK